MFKRRLALSFAAALLLAGCVAIPHASTSAPLPTATPMHLSPLYQLSMFVGGLGWASNLDQTNFYHSKNFGEHFLTVTPEGLAKQSTGRVFSSFPNGEIAWICQSALDSATLYSSSDSGRSWQIHTLNFPCGQMSFLNASEGYILSDNGVGAGSHYVSIYHTSDGGLNWDLRFSHDPSSADDHGLPSGGIKSAFVYLDTNIGLVAGSQPVPGSVYLYHTDNGGTSWSLSVCDGLPLDENQETSVENIFRINNKSAVVPIRSYLADGDSVTFFCSTSDAGKSWSYAGKLEGVEFSDFGTILTGVAYGQGKMFQTQDGGATWLETSSGLPIAVTPVSLNMVNDRFGYLTATITPDTLLENRIYMTGNNGKDWQAMPGNILPSALGTSTP